MTRPEKAAHRFFDRKVLNADAMIEHSTPFSVAAYRKFALHVHILETGTPSDSTVQIIVQFYNKEADEWSDYMNDAFGYMIWEEDAIPAGEKGLSVVTQGECVSRKMRVKLISAKGTTLDATNYFTVSVDADFMD